MSLKSHSNANGLTSQPTWASVHYDQTWFLINTAGRGLTDLFHFLCDLYKTDTWEFIHHDLNSWDPEFRPCNSREKSISHSNKISNQTLLKIQILETKTKHAKVPNHSPHETFYFTAQCCSFPYLQWHRSVLDGKSIAICLQCQLPQASQGTGFHWSWIPAELDSTHSAVTAFLNFLKVIGCLSLKGVN
jgi:hypothetical protein